MLIVIILAFCVWAASVEYGLGGGIERVRTSWQLNQIQLVVLTTVLLPLTGLVLVGTLLLESLRLHTRTRPQWLIGLGELFETGLFLAGGVFGLIFGFALLGAVLPASEVAALTFGIVFLGGAFLALRSHRRMRQWLIAHGHVTAARPYLLAIPVLAVVGGLVLAIGL